MSSKQFGKSKINKVIQSSKIFATNYCLKYLSVIIIYSSIIKFCTESLSKFFPVISGSFLKKNQVIKKQDQKISRNLITILGLTSIFIILLELKKYL